MKTILKTLFLTVIVLLTYSCNSNDDDPDFIPTPINTDVFFKYSLDGGNTYKEITFYNYFAKFHDKPTPEPDTFAFEIEGTTNYYEKISGQIYFPSNTFATFLTNPDSTTYPWGYPDYGSNPANASTFFFTDAVSPNPLFISLDSQITCTITEYPTNIGGYIAFVFSGTYTDASDSSITGTISGSARLQRGVDRID